MVNRENIDSGYPNFQLDTCSSGSRRNLDYLQIRRLTDEIGLKAKIAGMVGKRRRGPFTWKDEREVIAMATNGATASEIAAKFKTSVKTIERKARALGISIRDRRGQPGRK